MKDAMHRDPGPDRASVSPRSGARRFADTANRRDGDNKNAENGSKAGIEADRSTSGLWNPWLLSAGAAVIMGSVGLAADTLRTPMYGAEAKVALSPSNPGLQAARDEIEDPGSEAFLEGVLEFFADDPRRDALATAAANLAVIEDPTGGLLSVRTQAPEPGLAADLVNRVVREYAGLFAKLQTEESLAPGTPADDELLEGALEELRSTEEALARARTNLSRTSQRWQSVQDSTPEQLAADSESASLRANNRRLTELRQTLSDLSLTFTPANYQVREVQAEIQEVEEAIRLEVASIPDLAWSEYQDAVRLEASLQSEYERLRGEVAELSAREAPPNAQAETPEPPPIETASESELIGLSPGISFGAGALGGFLLAFALVFLRMRRRKQDKTGTKLELAEDTRPETIPETNPETENAVETASKKPATPAGTSKARTPAVETHAQIDVETDETADETDGDETEFKAEIERAERPASNGRIELESHADWNSPLAKSVRSLATTLLSEPARGAGRVITVSSPEKGEGKTTIACNLGIVLAAAGKRVLLLDGHLTDPRLTEIFQVSPTTGLGGILAGPLEMEDVSIESEILRTQFAGLYVLPSGRGAPFSAGGTENPIVSERVVQRLNALVGRLRSHFDISVFDTPALSERADARILARHTDGVVLVFGPDRTAADTSRTEWGRLKADGTRLLGTIHNRRDPAPATSPEGKRA